MTAGGNGGTTGVRRGRSTEDHERTLPVVPKTRAATECECRAKAVAVSRKLAASCQVMASQILAAPARPNHHGLMNPVAQNGFGTFLFDNAAAAASDGGTTWVTTQVGSRGGKPALGSNSNFTTKPYCGAYQ